MNMTIRKLLAVALGIVCSLTATFALAGGSSGRVIIDRLTVRDDRAIVLINESGTWRNPDLCDNNKRVILLPPGAAGSVLGYKEFYAALLGAHLTRRQISVFVNGCTLVGGKTFPIVVKVTVY